MFAVNQDRLETPSGDMLQGLGTGFLFVDRVVYWLQDEIRRAAMIRELSQLNDHYLRDIGIHRGEIHELADAMVKRRRESRRVAEKHTGDAYPARARPS
jgi:hypothetical protein